MLLVLLATEFSLTEIS